MERIARYFGNCESLASSHELGVDGEQKEDLGLSPLPDLCCDGYECVCSEERLRNLMTSKATCGHPS